MTQTEIPYYDKWKLTASGENGKVAFNCGHCSYPVYVWEEYIKTNEGNVHDGCFDEFAWMNLEASRQYAEEEEEEVYGGEIE